MTTDGTQPSLRMQDIAALALRRRKLVCAITASFFFLALLAAILMPRTYEATALIRMHSKRIIDPLVNGLAVSPDLKEDFYTLSRQIMTAHRLEQLVLQLGMAGPKATPLEREDLVDTVKGRVSMKIRDRDIIEIRFRDRDAARAQRGANLLAQNFIEENVRMKKEEAGSAIAFIAEQLQIYRKRLEHSQQNFSASKVDTDLYLALNRRELLQKKMSGLQKIVPSQVTTQQNSVVAQLQMRQGQLETGLARLLVDAREGNPQVAKIRQEIQAIRTRIEAETEKRSVTEDTATYNPLYLQVEQELQEADIEIADLFRRRKELEAPGRNASRKLSREELSTMERSKKVEEDIYQVLLRQLEMAYVSERLQDSEKGDRFSVIEYARLPLRPVGPRAAKVLGIGLFSGLLAGLGGAFLKENLMKPLLTAEQAGEALQLTVLGSISQFVVAGDIRENFLSRLGSTLDGYMKMSQRFSRMRFVSPQVVRAAPGAALAPPVVMHHEPGSRVADDFRTLRINVLHQRKRPRKPPVQVITLTSALRGEGKSTTAANLAVALADHGLKVLLIDADLRLGVLHRLFSLQPAPGLAEVVAGSVPAARALQAPAINLSVLTGGGQLLRPAELLGSAPFRELLKLFRSSFDMVLLDAPPVLRLPDPCVLSQQSDAVILVVRSDYTRQSDALRAKAALSRLNANIMGVVLTGVQYHLPQYLYDHYYDTV